jgi:hypothetical protein
MGRPLAAEVHDEMKKVILPMLRSHVYKLVNAAMQWLPITKLDIFIQD